MTGWEYDPVVDEAEEVVLALHLDTKLTDELLERMRDVAARAGERERRRLATALKKRLRRDAGLDSGEMVSIAKMVEERWARLERLRRARGLG
jgi:hypothetical protein